jgi:hypothetical protein
MTSLRRLFSGLLLGAFLLAPTPGNAMEPGNDQGTWKHPYGNMDLTFYTTAAPGSRWGGVETISSSSDVDYVLMACNGRNVTGVDIALDAGAGDLDIHVYDLAGNLLGSSGGVTSYETVYLSAFTKQAVMIKVYGYAGATGSYQPAVYCAT